MFPEMVGGILAANLALSELLHHFRVLMPLGLIELMAVVLEELVCRLESRALVAIDKSMVPGDALGIAGGKLKVIMLAIGMKVLGTCQGRFQKGRVTQSVCPAPNLDHAFMDGLYIGTGHPFWFAHRLASSMMVWR